MNLSGLSVEDYQRAEVAGKRQAGLVAIAAYSPAHFESRNFFTRISDLSDLWKYVDTMQDQRFVRNLNGGLGGGLSAAEFALMKRMVESVAAFSRKLDHPLTGRNAITRSLMHVRILEQLKGHIPGDQSGHLTIINLGDGCGYLSAMLAQAGHTVICIDVTQAFYLYQSHFLSHCLQDRFVETAAEDDPNPGIARACEMKGAVVHLPWWHLISGNLSLPKIDLVFANHMLSEMHPTALRHEFATIRNSNKQQHNARVPFLLCEGFGGEFDEIPRAMQRLVEIGFCPIFSHSFYQGAGIDDVYTCFGPEIPSRYIIRTLTSKAVARLGRDHEGSQWTPAADLLKVFKKGKFDQDMVFISDHVLSTTFMNSVKAHVPAVRTDDVVKYVQDVCASTGASFFTEDELFERTFDRKLEFQDVE